MLIGLGGSDRLPRRGLNRVDKVETRETIAVVPQCGCMLQEVEGFSHFLDTL